jgi:hypothetical protein
VATADRVHGFDWSNVVSGVAGASVTGVAAAFKRHRDLKSMEAAQIRRDMRQLQDQVLQLRTIVQERGAA